MIKKFVHKPVHGTALRS